MGRLLAGVLYFGATLTLLLAVNKQEMASYRASFKGSATWRASQSALDRFPFAFVLSISIAGIASAWLLVLRGFPFVAGLDLYLPEGLGQSCTRSMRRLTSR